MCKLIDWVAVHCPELDEPNDITRSHVRGWVRHLLDTTSAGNANTCYRSAKQWFTRLELAEEIDNRPMDRMKPPFRS